MDGAVCQKLEGKDSTRSQAAVPWVTTDPIQKNINSRSQLFLKSSSWTPSLRENGGVCMVSPQHLTKHVPWNTGPARGPGKGNPVVK